MEIYPIYEEVLTGSMMALNFLVSPEDCSSGQINVVPISSSILQVATELIFLGKLK